MSSSSRKREPKTASQRMQDRRARLREQGLRPVQFWVPDLRNPRVVADLRRQGRLLAKRSQQDREVDTWLEAAYDFSEWR